MIALGIEAPCLHRSLSHKDLEVACETQLPDMDLEVAEEAAVAPFLAPGVGKGVEGAGEALEGKEGASAEMHAAFEGLVDAGVLADFLKDAQVRNRLCLPPHELQQISSRQ